MEEVRVDLKMVKEKDLHDIQIIHDKVNHSLNDARYWRKNANPTKCSEAESRYKQFACELIEMTNRLIEAKEEKFTEYLSNWTRAQLEFYRTCYEISQTLDNSLREIGPIPLTPLEPLNPDLIDMGSGLTEEGEAVGPDPNATSAPISRPFEAPQQQKPYQPPNVSSGPPPIVRGPAPGTGLSSARANYPFNASAPEELSFNTGDVLTIHQKKGDWWTAELNGRRGLIPSNYVSLI